MDRQPRLLDVVALLTDIPEHGLVRGQVGTVVELLSGAYEVEFSDDEGRTYAQLALEPQQLLVLHHRPQRAALSAACLWARAASMTPTLAVQPRHAAV